MANITCTAGSILINYALTPSSLWQEGQTNVSFVSVGVKYESVQRIAYDLYYVRNGIGLLVADASGWVNASFMYMCIPTEQIVTTATSNYGYHQFDVSTLIRDRTQSDVEYAKSLIKKGQSNWTYNERTAWNAGLKGVWQSTADLTVSTDSRDLIKDAERLYNAMWYARDLFITCNKTINFPSESDICPTFCLEFYNAQKTIGAPLLEALMDQFETQAPWSSIQNPDPEDKYKKPSIPVFRFTFVAANELEDRVYRYIKAGRAFMDSI